MSDDSRDDSFDAAGQITSPGYVYDARGRLIAAPGYSLTWDGASRLVGYQTSGAASVSLGYNGLGNLIVRTADGATSRYAFQHALDLPAVAVEADAAGTPRRYYVWTPEGALLYSIDATAGYPVRFYHFDRVGSTLALTDATGAVTDAWAYDPFGRLLAHTGGSDQPFTFNGQFGVRQEGGAQLGLYQMRARYYDALAGRFLSPDPAPVDPADLNTLNPYAFANNSPLEYLDPDGAAPEIVRRKPEIVRKAKPLPDGTWPTGKGNASVKYKGQTLHLKLRAVPGANANIGDIVRPGRVLDFPHLAKVQAQEPLNPGVRGRFVRPPLRQNIVNPAKIAGRVAGRVFLAVSIAEIFWRIALHDVAKAHQKVLEAKARAEQPFDFAAWRRQRWHEAWKHEFNAKVKALQKELIAKGFGQRQVNHKVCTWMMNWLKANLTPEECEEFGYGKNCEGRK